METIARLSWIADKALRFLAGLCLALLATLVVAQVVMRYGLKAAPSYTEELARYAMIWMALFAAAVGVREASHIRIDFIPELLGRLFPQAARVLDLVLDLVSIAIFVVLLWYGVDAMRFAMGQASPGMQIPLGIPYAALPMAFGFATLFALARLSLRKPGT